MIAPVTDHEAQRALRQASMTLLLTGLFWLSGTAVMVGGSVYVVAQQGFEYVVPGVLLTFTVGTGAWFWIRESYLVWRDARAETGAPTSR